MVLTSEETRTFKKYAASISPPVNEAVVTAVKRRRPRPKQKRTRVKRDSRECPECGRRIATIDGKMISHRMKVDRRGYGNGGWCPYYEV